MNHPHRASSLAAAAIRYLAHGWLSLAAVAGAAAIPAQAAALSEASTFVQCSADGNSSFDQKECTVGGIPGVPSSASASAMLSPPGVAAEASSPVAGVFGAGTSSELSYSFQVTGGNVDDVVPILIDASLNALSTPDGSALARVIIRTAVLAVPLVEEVCTDGSCTATSFSGTLSTQTRSGSTVDSVTLFVQAQASPTHSSNESASAFADPFIFVDPAFPNASLYSIVVSPGVANVPVPEPGTLWLVATALGALSLSRRRYL